MNQSFTFEMGVCQKVPRKAKFRLQTLYQVKCKRSVARETGQTHPYICLNFPASPYCVRHLKVKRYDGRLR